MLAGKGRKVFRKFRGKRKRRKQRRKEKRQLKNQFRSTSSIPSTSRPTRSSTRQRATPSPRTPAAKKQRIADKLGISGGLSFGSAQSKYLIPFFIIVGIVLIAVIRSFSLKSGKR